MGTITRYEVILAVIAGVGLTTLASEAPQTQADTPAYAVVAGTINGVESFKPCSIKNQLAELLLVISSPEDR
jgi:hypothetical protein